MARFHWKSFIRGWVLIRHVYVHVSFSFTDKNVYIVYVRFGEQQPHCIWQPFRNADASQLESVTVLNSMIHFNYIVFSLFFLALQSTVARERERPP